MLLYHRRDKDPIIAYSLSKKVVESMENSYVATQSEIKDTPKELMERIKTVDSRGAYNETNFGISIKSMPKKDCILPATYNQDTFSCDCPLGSDYIEMYGCKTKCPHWKQYNTDGTCTDYCDISTHPHQYWNGSSCTDCPIGTKNDGNNHCIPLNPCPNAMDYTTESPYKCVSSNSCQPYEMSVEGQCYTKCPVEHEIYDVISGSCVSCYKAGTNYTVNQINDGSNNCTTGTYTCKKGEHIDPITGVCVSQCLDYQKFVGFETIAGSCGSTKAICVEKCATNQYYDSYLADCRYCPVGQTSNGKNGCVPVQVTPIPTPNCTAGFQLNSDNTRCESKCDYWRYNDDVDPTYCDLLCPAATQFYDLTLGTDLQGNKINNGCADCPVGWATDNDNKCTICDDAGGYVKRGTECIPSCHDWQKWDEEHHICDYLCPDHRQYYINGKGCAYCEVGYLTVPDLSNNCKSTQDNCDNEKGYFAKGQDKNGYTKCENACSPWQYWDNTLLTPRCVNHCTVKPDLYYDVSLDMCVKCEDLYPAIPSSQLTFDAENNKCIVKVPTPTPTSAATFAPTSTTTSAAKFTPTPSSLPDSIKCPCETSLEFHSDDRYNVCNCCGTGDSTQQKYSVHGAAPWSNDPGRDDPTRCYLPVGGKPPPPSTPSPPPPPPPPPPSEIMVVRNNGTVSCDRYCAGMSGASWNRELPDGRADNPTWDKMYNWNGAKCVKALNNDGTNGDCYAIRGLEDTTAKCVCAASGTGWETGPWGKADVVATCKYKDRTYNNDDYQNSCYNVNISSTGVITATCDNYGTPASATINSCDCAGRIRNVGGKLVCQ